LAFYLGIKSKIMVHGTDLGGMAGAGTWWHWSTTFQVLDPEGKSVAILWGQF
jgi:hypothetical protein